MNPIFYPKDYMGNAFFAFQSRALKDEVRDILLAVSLGHFRITNAYQSTPWKTNIFRIEEFTKYSSNAEAYNILEPLNGGAQFQQGDFPIISTSNTLMSYAAAQSFLENDSTGNIKKVIEQANVKGLNYIIHGTNKVLFQSAGRESQDVVAMQTLSDIRLKLFGTFVAEQSDDFRNGMYAYTENGTLNFIFKP